MCFMRISDFQYGTEFRLKAGRINCNAPALVVVFCFFSVTLKMIKKTSRNAVTVVKKKSVRLDTFVCVCFIVAVWCIS